MVKFFDAFKLSDLRDQIQRFGDRDDVEITSISHCQVQNRGIISPLKQWNAFVSYKTVDRK